MCTYTCEKHEGGQGLAKQNNLNKLLSQCHEKSFSNTLHWSIKYIKSLFLVGNLNGVILSAIQTEHNLIVAVVTLQSTQSCRTGSYFVISPVPKAGTLAFNFISELVLVWMSSNTKGQWKGSRAHNCKNSYTPTCGTESGGTETLPWCGPRFLGRLVLVTGVSLMLPRLLLLRLPPLRQKNPGVAAKVPEKRGGDDLEI